MSNLTARSNMGRPGNPLTLTLELAGVIRRLGGSVLVGIIFISTRGLPLSNDCEKAATGKLN